MCEPGVKIALLGGRIVHDEIEMRGIEPAILDHGVRPPAGAIARDRLAAQLGIEHEGAKRFPVHLRISCEAAKAREPVEPVPRFLAPLIVHGGRLVHIEALQA